MPASVSGFSELDENGEFIEQAPINKEFLGQKSWKTRMGSATTKLAAARQFRNRGSAAAPPINQQVVMDNVDLKM